MAFAARRGGDPGGRRGRRAERSPRQLYAPADVEPDLIVILGPHDRLPPSLVWELAYGELVFWTATCRRSSPAADLQRRRSTSSTVAAGASAGLDPDSMTCDSHLYRDTAVVLRTYKLGEADRIVVLLTAENGKVRAVAKGVRKTKSQFGARLEPMSHVRLLLYRGRELDIVSQAESVEPLAPMLATLDRASQGMAVLEAADQLALEREPNPQLYRMVVGVLRTIAERPSPLVVPAFYWKLLAAEGLAPRARRLRALRRGRLDDARSSPSTSPRAGCCAARAASGVAAVGGGAGAAARRSSAAGSTKRSPRPSRRRPTRSASSPPRPSNTTSNAASAPSPCSNADASASASIGTTARTGFADEYGQIAVLSRSSGLLALRYIDIDRQLERWRRTARRRSAASRHSTIGASRAGSSATSFASHYCIAGPAVSMTRRDADVATPVHRIAELSSMADGGRWCHRRARCTR